MVAAPRAPRRLALVVEDDQSCRALATSALTREGFAVVEADTLDAARRVLTCQPVDVVVLDIGLPDESGLRLLEELRQEHAMPIIIVSGYADVEDRVAGLRMGADDYLTKPFSPSELAARVYAVVRRSRAVSEQERIAFDDGLQIDLGAREVSRGGRLIPLRPREFDVLAMLATHPRRVISREELLRSVWRSSSEWQTAATVTEHVRKLRLALEADAGATAHIVTIRGIGYRWDP